MSNVTPFQICKIITSQRLPFINITRSTIEIIPCQSSVAVVGTTVYFHLWKESQPQTPVGEFEGVNADCIRSNDGYVEREMEGFSGPETAKVTSIRRIDALQNTKSENNLPLSLFINSLDKSNE